MTYIIVNSGPLSGLPIVESSRLGPPRGGNGMFTQWGPNGVFGRGQGRRQLGGFGEVAIPAGASDGAKREIIAANFNVVAEGWRSQLNEMIDTQLGVKAGLLALNPLVFARARSQIVAARDGIRGSLIPKALEVVRNQSLPLSTMQARLSEFVRNTAATLDAQVRDASLQAQRATFTGQANVFLDALQKVVVATTEAAVRTAAKGLNAGVEELKDSPTTVIVLATAVIVAIWFKSQSR